MAAADLHFRGFSKADHPSRSASSPKSSTIRRVSSTSMWNPTPGNYTRYGDVGELLADVDDRMVIMGSGDEVPLRFDATRLPPLPAGWKRDFLLLVDGWAKDADANTAFSQSVLPLPFHGMSRYPYPNGERYPQDPTHAAYLEDADPACTPPVASALFRAPRTDALLRPPENTAQRTDWRGSRGVVWPFGRYPFFVLTKFGPIGRAWKGSEASINQAQSAHYEEIIVHAASLMSKLRFHCEVWDRVW